MGSRNWNWTINRRMRKIGWQILKYPPPGNLFHFLPELQRITALTDPGELSDLATFFFGLKVLISNSGEINSQLGQEIFVLSQTANIINPTFLEIGAYDPIHWSNTASLREYFGWTGLHVDPNSETAKKFNQAGLAQNFIHAAVSTTKQERVFLQSAGAMSTISDFPLNSNDEAVLVINPQDLVHRSKKVDYLSLDIEGGEYDVLAAWPWEACSPKVITVEHNFREIEKTKIKNLLNQKGYREFLPSLTDFESWFVKT